MNTSNHELIFSALDSVEKILREHECEPLLIGAAAMAVYNYTRTTDDVDLGIITDLKTMHNICHALQKNNFYAELREPDSFDPLNGVIDIRGEFGLIQLINFLDRFPAVIEDGIKYAKLTIHEKSNIKIAPLEQLIALKLYAGGQKSKTDISELINRNPELDINRLRYFCKKYRLKSQNLF